VTTIRRIVPVCALAAGLVLVSSVSAGKGPAPGVQLEGRGVTSVGGAVPYATRELAGSTRVTAFDGDGRKLRQGTVTGALGIPYVAFDGSLGGLAHDGRTLVLASPAPVGGHSRFAVLRTAGLALRHRLALRGTWSFDALSPDGRTLYLVEHAPAPSATYRVRAYDLRRGTLLREAVVDPRLGGRAMTGRPVTRAADPRGIWAYTLYQKSGGLPFVHALDTVRGKALCIELPWRGDQARLSDVRMGVRGGSLVLRSRAGTHLATIDRSAFEVHAHVNPLRREAGRAR
jgi:hypothetical protein